MTRESFTGASISFYLFLLFLLAVDGRSLFHVQLNTFQGLLITTSQVCNDPVGRGAKKRMNERQSITQVDQWPEDLYEFS